MNNAEFEFKLFKLCTNLGCNVILKSAYYDVLFIAILHILSIWKKIYLKKGFIKEFSIDIV